MPFKSILFHHSDSIVINDPPVIQDFIGDLNIDQIIDSITSPKQEYNLKPFFYAPLSDFELIKYRQDILRDLESQELFKCVRLFAEGMTKVRTYLLKSNKYYYALQKQRWFLDAAGLYFGCLIKFNNDLADIDIKSSGFIEFRDYLADYVSSTKFKAINDEIINIQNGLARVKYSLLIRDNTISVRAYENEGNYQKDIEKTFAKFKQNSKKSFLYEFGYENEMNHIEAAIIQFVAAQNPDVFNALSAFSKEHADFQDEIIVNFDREVQFYISYLEYILRFQKSGYHFCYPEMTREKDIFSKSCFDLALAKNLINENKRIIRNDFYLKGKERIIIVTGPNQGGKTTFARTFGQLHYFGSLGCMVPGLDARLFMFDNIFTHFEKQENIKNLRGKLQDDLIRFSEIFNQATTNSIFLINEIFSSTTLSDAIFLAKEILKKIIELDSFCVCVTFIDELSTMSEKTVSMVSNVDENNHAHRTFKIKRKVADGLSYAISIAEKYNLTYSQIKERIR